MKRVATDKHEAIVAVPEVVRPAIVAVEPSTVVIPFNIEHIEIAIRAGNV